LRDELPRLLSDRHCIVVYATTEPAEALLFGGNIATLHEGRVTQFGPTAAVYRQPGDLLTARVFSDPPINTATARKEGSRISLDGTAHWSALGPIAAARDGTYTIAVRPHHVTPFQPSADAVPVDGRVLITELSGSESVVHFELGGQTWVSQSHGIPSRSSTQAEVLCRCGPGHLLRFRQAADRQWLKSRSARSGIRTSPVPLGTRIGRSRSCRCAGRMGAPMPCSAHLVAARRRFSI
jgi:ABC-type sugar transport system ATPase subunit